MKILSFVSPVHAHDCTDCTFKGAVKLGRGKTASLVDIYTCDSEVIIRTGSEPSECRTRTVDAMGSDVLADAAIAMIAMNGKPSVWTRELIRERLEINDSWVKRGILSIFNLQTESEQASECTAEDNGVGFSGCDAELMSSFAKQLLQRGSLSPKQMGWARKKMLKYAGQLAKIANGEITA
jgi:hypothetical protein